MGCGGRRAGGGRALAWDRGARGSSRIVELRAVGLGSAGQRWGARCCREPGSAARGRGARGSPGWEAQAGAGERGAARGWGAQAARAGKQGAGGGGGGARAREAGAGAREAPPLTITIDAPRIMKIMVFALMDIGRGRAGPERRPPAPAPPRPRPDAGPPAASAEVSPPRTRRGGGAAGGAGRDAAAPGVARPPGRRARRARALRSALGLLPPRARRRSGLRRLPALRARLPGGAAPPACPAPRRGPDPSPGTAGRALARPGPGRLPSAPGPRSHRRTSPCRPGEGPGLPPQTLLLRLGATRTWLASGFLQQVPAFGGGPCREVTPKPWPHGPAKAKGRAAVGARPASAPSSLGGQHQAPGLGSLEVQASVHGSLQAAP